MSSTPALATSIAAAAEARVAVPHQTEAAARHRYGAPVAVHAVDVPTPNDDEVLIEVHAAGIDRGTHHVHTGTPYLMRLAGFGLTKPTQPVLGMDVSGVVVATGANVTRFVAGDEVFGVGTGTFARYAIAPERKLSRKPTNVPHDETAAIPISGSTALQALQDKGRIKAGQRVLILGASGGVGSYAVQIAKTFGAEVTGVASGPKLAMVRALGADHAIDYTTTDALDGSAQYDLIVDIGGRNSIHRLRQALANKGCLVIVGGEGGNRITGGIGRQVLAAVMSPFVSQRLVSFIAKEGREHTDTLAHLASTGAIRAEVRHHYQLVEVQDALDDMESGRVSGKAVVCVATNPVHDALVEGMESR